MCCNVHASRSRLSCLRNDRRPISAVPRHAEAGTIVLQLRASVTSTEAGYLQPLRASTLKLPTQEQESTHTPALYWEALASLVA